MKQGDLPVDPTIIPKSFNFATDIVDHWAERSPKSIALHWTDQSLSRERKLTYGHFAKRSRVIATLFKSLGIERGSTCVIILPRLPEWWEVATACLRAGIILCPCTTLLVDKDIEYRLQVSKADVFVGDEASVAKLLKVRDKCHHLRRIVQIGGIPAKGQNIISFESEVYNIHPDADFETTQQNPSAPALIFFTSGTTGNPKMVLHSQISYPLAHALTGIHWLQLSPSSVYWNLSEQGWAKAAWSFFSTWNCGATLFVHDDRQAFDPKRTLGVLKKFPITTLCAPPTVYRQLILNENQEHFRDPKMKTLIHACGAGEPLNDSVIKKWKELTDGMEIFDGYGQTETILTCANQAGNPIKYGSLGKPIPGVPLDVIDADGQVSGVDAEGDIAIEIQDGRDKFFGIFKGYINSGIDDLDQRIKTFDNGKKYYLTGDRATRDNDGYIRFVGRNDDVINSSGYRIGPFEVESALKMHSTVVESAVVASPDPKRDEVVKAFVVLTSEAHSRIANNSTETEKHIKVLQAFCKENAAPYKYPRKIEFVDAAFLPKTISGKIKRAELRKLEKERYEKSGKAKL